MWGKKRKYDEDGTLPTKENSGSSSSTPTSVDTLEPDDVIFSHPGAAGAMMLPVRALKAGIFGGRRRKERKTKSNSKTQSGEKMVSSPEHQTQQQVTEQTGQHPLCSGSPARVEELVSETRDAKAAEAALREEAARLIAKNSQLERHIIKLEREKERMTGAHQVEVDRIRRELEASARESKRRLESELERGHAKSMDNLRLTLRQETDRLAGETKRLRDDLHGAREASRAATATFSLPSAKRPTAGGSSGDASHGYSAGAGTYGGNRGQSRSSNTADEPIVPRSVSFWKSFTETFTPHDFADTGGGGGGGGAAMSTTPPPPPALLVLAAVPLYCFYRRWRNQRILEDDCGSSSDDGQATDGEAESELDESELRERDGEQDALTQTAPAMAAGGMLRAATKMDGACPGLKPRRAVSCSPMKLRVGRTLESAPSLSLVGSPRNPEALISPSVCVSRASTARQRHAGSLTRTVDREPVGRGAGGNVKASAGRESKEEHADEPACEVESTPTKALVDREDEGAESSSSSSCCSKRTSSSASPSPERTIASTGESADSKEAVDEPSLRNASATVTAVAVTSAKKHLSPSLLRRAQWRQQHHREQQQQQQQRSQNAQRSVRPAPRGLAAAAAMAAARAAERQSISAADFSADPSSGAKVKKGTAPFRAVPAEAALGSGDGSGNERAEGTRAMRGALEGLRSDRDSLANACGRLEAEREASSVRLRESAERVRELEAASEMLLREKCALEQRCADLERRQKDADGEENQEEEDATEDEVQGARERPAAELAEERSSAANQATAAKAGRVDLDARIAELEEAVADASARAAAAVADSSNYSAAAAALATAETRAAGEAAGLSQALAQKEEEAESLRELSRHAEDDKQVLASELEALKAEVARGAEQSGDLRQRLAEQDSDLADLHAQLAAEREAAAHAATAAAAIAASQPASDTREFEHRQALLAESRAKLSALEDASFRTAAELKEANEYVQRLQAESAEQQALFEEKVVELEAAGARVSMLEESMSRHLAKQRDLEDELQRLRQQTVRLEARREELEAEAATAAAERASELDDLRARAADLSSQLQCSDASRESADIEARRLSRQLEDRVRQLELEKQAQAADFERKLEERVADLKALAVAQEATVREQELLDARYAEQLHTLEAENASLQAEIREKYASASEELQALSQEKREAEAACLRLRGEAGELEQRAERAASELKDLAERNASLSHDADSARALLGQRGQELARLAAEAAEDAAAANASLSEAEQHAAAERKQANARILELSEEVAAAAAVARVAGERHAKETGDLREEAARLATELETLARVKRDGDEKTTAALGEKAQMLAEAMKDIKRLENEAAAGKRAAATLEQEVREGKTQLAELSEELRQSRVTVGRAKEEGERQALELCDQLAAKESEVECLEGRLAHLSSDLRAAHTVAEAADKATCRASSRAEELGSELRACAAALAQAREGVDSKEVEVELLTEGIQVLRARLDEQAAALDRAVAREEATSAMLQAQLLEAQNELASSRKELSASVDRTSKADARLAQAREVEAQLRQAANEAAAAASEKMDAEAEEAERAAAAAAERLATVTKELDESRAAGREEGLKAEDRLRRVEELSARLELSRQECGALEASAAESAARSAAEMATLSASRDAAVAGACAAQALAAKREERLRQDARELGASAEAAGERAAGELAIKAAEAASLAGEVREARAAAEAAEACVQELAAQLAGVTREVEGLEKELADAKELTDKMAGEAATRASELEREVEGLRDWGEGLQAEAEAVKGRLRELQESSEAESDKMRAALESKTQALDDAAREHMEASAKAEEDLTRLRQEADSKEAEESASAAGWEEEKSALETRLHELEGHKTAQKAELESVSALRDAAVAQAKTLECELKGYAGQVSTIEARLGDKERELADVALERNDLDAKVSSLETRVKELEAESNKAEMDLAAMPDDNRSGTATDDARASAGGGGGGGEGDPEIATKASAPSGPAPAALTEGDPDKGLEITTGVAPLAEGLHMHTPVTEERSPEKTSGGASSGRRQSHDSQTSVVEVSRVDPERASLEEKAEKLQKKLHKKQHQLAIAEQSVLVLEAEKEEVVHMVKSLRQGQAELVAELHRRREKVVAELKQTKRDQREAEKRCRELEEEREAMADDYEGRLQQQASNYEQQIASIRGAGPSEASAEAEADLLRKHIEEIEAARKLTSRRLREVGKRHSLNSERFEVTLEKEREKGERLEQMLDECRQERDAECERLQKNIDSLKEQLDVKVATVKHLWEKVAAMRRSKAVGSEELKANLDDAVAARDSLSRLAEDQQEQIDRLRRRAKRKEEEITKTVLARLQNQRGSEGSVIDLDNDDSPRSGGCRTRREGRDSFDSAQGTSRGASAALRSQLADIKAERMDLMCKCQRQEQMVTDLRALIDDIARLEKGAPDVVGGDANWETLSMCSDISGMSQESSLMPKGIDDVPEADLRELAKWFRSRGTERRRLLKRYRAGRKKTEALAARKQAGIDMFAAARGSKVPMKSNSSRSPNSDAESVRSTRSARSARSTGTAASNLSSHISKTGGRSGDGSSKPSDSKAGADVRSKQPASPLTFKHGPDSPASFGGKRQGLGGGAPNSRAFSRPVVRSRLSGGGGGGGAGGGGGGGGFGGKSGIRTPSNRKSPRAGTRAMGGRTGWL